MSNTHFDLDYLIQPIGSEVFFSQYWEQKPLHISRKNRDYYTDLFSIDDIDTLIHFSKPKYPRVKLGKNNKKGFSLEVLEGTKNASMHTYGVPNLKRLYDAYTEGDTLLIYRLEQYWEPFAHFCRELEQYFSYLINAALFLTPKNAQGFLPHFDLADMFILQVEGAKVWRIYNSSPYLTLQEDEQPPFLGNLSAPEQEIYLEAGDMLYIPRGCVHEVLTTDTFSLHISIGAKVTTWADLIASALKSISRQNLPFHKGLPVGFLNQSQLAPSLQAQLTELLALLSQKANAEEAVSQLACEFIDNMQPLPDGHFSQLEQVERVNLHSVVAKRKGTICRIFKQTEMPAGVEGYLQSDDCVSIQFPGNEVRGPSWLEPAYRFIAETETFAVRDLPDRLSDNAKLVLVRRLIREGLLRIVSVNDKEVETEFANAVSDRELALSTK